MEAEERKVVNIQKTTLIMTIIVVVVKLFGLLRDLVLANVYQTSSISDAFLIAFSIPSVLFAILGKSVATSYLPVFLSVEKEKGEGEAEKYTTKVCIYGAIISAILIAIVAIFPRQVIRLFASGFDDATLEMCKNILLIGIFSIFFMLLTSVFTHYLQNKKMYLITTMVSLPLNIIIIVSIFLSKHIGYLVLGYGILLAFASEFLLLVPFIFKNKFKPRPAIKFDSHMRKTCLLIGPILLGSCASQINHTLDKSIASKYGTGGVSILSYSSTLNVAIQELLVTSLLAVVFVEFSNLFVQKKFDVIKEKTNSIFNTMTCILIPVSFIVCFFNKEIVRLLFFANPNVSEESITIIGRCLAAYSIGIIFVAFRDLYIKIFYAKQETLIPTINSVLTIGLNIGLNYLLFYLIGIEGIAIATSISAIVAFITLAISFRKRYFAIGAGKIASKVLTVLVISFVSVITCKKLFELLSSQINFYVSLVIIGIVFVALYFVQCKIFGIKELSELAKSIKGRKQK